MQTALTLTRRRVLLRLIWIYTVFLGPIYGTLSTGLILAVLKEDRLVLSLATSVVNSENFNDDHYI